MVALLLLTLSPSNSVRMTSLLSGHFKIAPYGFISSDYNYRITEFQLRRLGIF